MAVQNTQTQDPNDLINQLAQWAANGGVQAPNNVPQSSSPAITADSAQSIGGGQQNQGNVNRQPADANLNGPATPDYGALLKGLINSVNTSTQNGSGGMNGTSSPQPNAYQKGVNKALQTAGQAHAAQAIQAGVDPNSIVNHPIMGNGGQAQPQMQVPTGQPQTAQQPQQQQPVSIQDQISQLNQQSALNVAKKNLQASQPTNFMQRFSQNFTKMTGGVTQADQLENMGTIQKLAAAEPIQPKDVADLNARSYAAAMDAAHNGVTAEATKLAGLEDLYGKEQPNRSPIEAMMGRESKNQTLIRQNIEKSAENITNHLSNLRTLVANRPTFSTQGVDRQAQSLSKMIEGGVYKDGSGNTAKYVGGKFVPVSGGK